MINEIMRKFGFISEKELVNIAVQVYEIYEVGKTRNEKGFDYCCGNVNAVVYIMSIFRIDIASVFKERKKKVIGE